MAQFINFSIVQDEIALVPADVIALKYAQDYYGIEQSVVQRLVDNGMEFLDNLRPSVGDYRFVESRGALGAVRLLLIGVQNPSAFSYDEIQFFCSQTLSILKDRAPETRHLITTVHGLGFGMDETQALIAQLATYIESMRSGDIPPALEAITIIERSAGRVARLRKVVDALLPNEGYAAASALTDTWGYRIDTALLNGSQTASRARIAPEKSVPAILMTAPSATSAPPRQTVEEAARQIQSRAHIFVAMPFRKELDDLFIYGIQAPIHAAGFACHRVDKAVFTGDILEQIKRQIETSALVVAVLTGANPNVYLELGYAWGRGVPTLLVADTLDHLSFDVRNHRCLVYDRIRDMEEMLTAELSEMRLEGRL